MQGFRHIPENIVNDGGITIKISSTSTIVTVDMGDKVQTTEIDDKLLPKVLRDEKIRLYEGEEFIVEFKEGFENGTTNVDRKFLGTILKFHGTYTSFHKNQMFLMGSFVNNGGLVRETNEVVGTIKDGGMIDVQVKYGTDKHMYTIVRAINDGIIIENKLRSLLPPPTHSAIKKILRQLYGVNFEDEAKEMEVFTKNNNIIKDKPLTYHLDQDGVSLFDYKADPLPVDVKTYKFLEAVIKQVIKFHSEMEAHYLIETFVIGDFVAGAIKGSELRQGRK